MKNKDTGSIEKGYIWVPYIIENVGIVVETTSSRYLDKQVNPKFYSTIKITNEK